MSTDAAHLLSAVRATLVAAGFPFGRGASAGTVVLRDATALLSGPRVRVEYLADHEGTARLRLEAQRAEEALVAAGFRCTPSVDVGVFFALPRPAAVVTQESCLCGSSATATLAGSWDGWARCPDCGMC